MQNPNKEPALVDMIPLSPVSSFTRLSQDAPRGSAESFIIGSFQPSSLLLMKSAEFKMEYREGCKLSISNSHYSNLI